MEIKITIGKDICNDSNIVRVDCYRTHDAFLHPEKNENDVICCATEIRRHSQNWEKIIDAIEINTNQCLREMEKENGTK